MPQHQPGGAGRRPALTPVAAARDLADADDEVLAAVLIRMWALASGRTLRRDVPPDQLSPAELIEFWADDLTPPAGRHARPGGAEHPQPQAPQAPPRPVRSGRKRRQAQKRPASDRAEVAADPAAA
jgi:hypothetical protein